MSTVAVYIVTYHRHRLLRRSISSVLSQTVRDLVAYVVNDDPKDSEIEGIVSEFNDDRLRVFLPVKKRGAAGSFNLVFREQETRYAALLEDDNWWEPTFLESQILALDRYPEAPLIVSNERVWQELADGEWKNTGTTIWPFNDLRLHSVTLTGICGSATICNSSMLVRVNRPDSLLIPNDIPVDVTEHFRERLLPATFPLNGAPLVNYSVTRETARDSTGTRWSMYQIILIGSVFAAISNSASRRKIADKLWQETESGSPRSTSLACAGLIIPEARELFIRAPLWAKVRCVIFLARRPKAAARFARCRSLLTEHFAFLSEAPLTRELARAVND